MRAPMPGSFTCSYPAWVVSDLTKQIFRNEHQRWRETAIFVPLCGKPRRWHIQQCTELFQISSPWCTGFSNTSFFFQSITPKWEADIGRHRLRRSSASDRVDQSGSECFCGILTWTMIADDGMTLSSKVWSPRCFILRYSQHMANLDSDNLHSWRFILRVFLRSFRFSVISVVSSVFKVPASSFFKGF